MERRKYTRAFKLEAVKLIRERGVTVAQASRDLGGKASTAEMVRAIAGAL
jgi:transposase-like protein